LFNVVSQADPPIPGRSADPHLISLDPSAPPYVGGNDGVDQIEEGAQLLFDQSSPPHPVPVGRSAETRPTLPPNPPPPTQTVFTELGQVTDFMGILFVFCQAASLLDLGGGGTDLLRPLRPKYRNTVEKYEKYAQIRSSLVGFILK